MIYLTGAALTALIFGVIWVFSSYVSDCDTWFMFRRRIYFRLYDGRMETGGREHGIGRAYLHGAAKMGPVTLRPDKSVTGLSFVKYWAYDPFTLKDI